MLGELKDTDEVVCAYLQLTNIKKDKRVITANVKSIKKVGKADVYNMEVEKYHNFIANGIVVHNSIDALRYIVRVFNDTGRIPNV